MPDVLSINLNLCFCRLEHLVQGAKEPSAFLKWQKEMKEKDLQEKLVHLELRRLEGKISHEDALLARQRVHGHNLHKALLKKEEVSYHVLII